MTSKSQRVGHIPHNMKNILLNLEDTIPELDTLQKGSVVNWAELKHI